jgi:hypothetical protein
MDELGCNGYFIKPSEYVDFMKLGSVVNELLASAAFRLQDDPACGPPFDGHCVL